MLNLFQHFKRGNLDAAIVFCFALLVYLLTLSPLIYIEDSSEFITAAYTLGIPHPTGYPLYVILGKIFTFLPFGSIAEKVNLLSAVAGAGAVAVLFLLLRRLNISRLVSFVAAFTLAFSVVWWSQSVIAEVYTLHTLFGALSLYFWQRWRESRRIKFLYVSIGLVGLGSANHPLLAFLLLPYCLYLFRDWFRHQINFSQLLAASGWFGLGLSVYLYLPIRVFGRADFRFNNLQGWGDIINFLNRRYYGDVGFQFNWQKISLILDSFIKSAEMNFGITVVVLLAISVGWWYKHKRKQFWFWLLVLFSQFLPIALLRSSGYGLDLDYNNRVYYFISFVVMLVWLAGMFDFYWQKLKTKKVKWVGLLLLVALPSYLLLKNFSASNRSDYCLADAYVKAMMDSLPNGAVLLMHGGGYVGDSVLFGLGYLQYVKNYRPDVTVIDNNVIFHLPPSIDSGYIRSAQDKDQLFARLVEEAWNYAQNRNLPLFTTFAVERYSNLVSRSNGVLYQIFANKDQATDLPNALPYLCGQDSEFVKNDFANQDVLANYFYNQASWYWDQGRKDKYTNLIKQAILLDNEPMGEEYLQLLSHKQIFVQPQD